MPVWSDEICLHRALTEVIGPSVPPLVQDLRPRQNPNPGNAPVPRFATAAPPKSTLPPEFVVGPKGAATVFDANQISLASAKKIAQVCRDLTAAGDHQLYTRDLFYHQTRSAEFLRTLRKDPQFGEPPPLPIAGGSARAPPARMPS